MSWKDELFSETYALNEQRAINARKSRERYASGNDTRRGYYREKIAEDPLFNRKNHIRRKSADLNWQTDRGDRQNLALWNKIIAYVQSSDKTVEDLTNELNLKYRLFYRSHEHKNTQRDVYRPRIQQSRLTDEQKKELAEYTMSAGLTSEAEITKTSVIYKDRCVGIDHKPQQKRVDVYTGHEKELNER